MAGVAKTKKAPEVFISEADEYLFAQGTHYEHLQKTGGPPFRGERKEGNVFCCLGAACAAGTCFRYLQRMGGNPIPNEKKGAGRNL